MTTEFGQAVSIFVNHPDHWICERNLPTDTQQKSIFDNTIPVMATIPSSAIQTKTSSSAEEDIYSLQAKITTQQSLIKQLKKDGGTAESIGVETAKLLELRALAADLEKAAAPAELFNRKSFDELILRKMYVVPSFEIHNGPAGLFDYGPPACALKANVLAQWRQHFVLEEGMLEMECTNLTPSSVLETSGHVERFTDFMTRDVQTGECFRADKLLEDAIDRFLAARPGLGADEAEQHRVIQRQADAFSSTELDELLLRYEVFSPSAAGQRIPLTPCFPFNLMFKTTIGPEGTSVGFLRPETAQGLFVNFRRLLDFNQGRMPFAAAQIGLGFRNEIAPRNGLLRVREFCMAEIEHFVDPSDKSHPRLAMQAAEILTLFPAEAQLSTGRTVDMPVGDAVKTCVINNETLGYFMCRTQQWLVRIGVKRDRVRFRQHLKTEMAHYAADCWDAEILMSYGWIECVGHADRACYDLEQHSRRTGVSMQASTRLPQPITITREVAVPNKRLLGPRFKLEQKAVNEAIEGLEGAELQEFKTALAGQGEALLQGKYAVTADLVSFETEQKTVCEVKYTPSVIEPSYGIGRILYAVLEHSFSQRHGDEQRCVMAFRPCVAPIKVGIFPLTGNDDLRLVTQRLREAFQRAGVANRLDASAGTVGRRYSRADELGIPFGVTVDFQTLMDGSVTLRDRDSMAQVRIPGDRLVSLVQALVGEELDWARVMTRFAVVNTGGSEEDEDGSPQLATVPLTVSKTSTVIEHTPRARFSRPNTVTVAAN